MPNSTATPTNCQVPKHIEEAKKYKKAIMFGWPHVLCVVWDVWAEHLSTPELVTLTFAINRTLRYGKTAESISQGQFIDGVYAASGDGTRVTCGTGLYEKTHRAAIKKLQSLNILHVYKSSSRGMNNKNVIEIDCNTLVGGVVSKLKMKRGAREIQDNDWVEQALTSLLDSVVSPEKNSKLRTSKKARTQQRQGGEKAPIRWGEKAPNISTILKPLNTIKDRVTRKRATRADESLSEAIASAQTASTTRRKDKASSAARAPSLTMAGIKVLWQEAMLQHYATVSTPNVSAEVVGRLKRAVGANRVSVPLPEFLSWVVGNWSSLREGKLSWLNKKEEGMPSLPSLSLVARLFSHFVAAHADAAVKRTEHKVKIRAVADTDELEVLRNRAMRAEANNSKLAERNKQLEQIAYRKPTPQGPAAQKQEMVDWGGISEYAE